MTTWILFKQYTLGQKPEKAQMHYNKHSGCVPVRGMSKDAAGAWAFGCCTVTVHTQAVTQPTSSTTPTSAMQLCCSLLPLEQKTPIIQVAIECTDLYSWPIRVSQSLSAPAQQGLNILPLLHFTDSCAEPLCQYIAPGVKNPHRTVVGLKFRWWCGTQNRHVSFITIVKKAGFLRRG